MSYEELARQMVDIHTKNYGEVSQIARHMVAGGEVTILHLLHNATQDTFAEDLARMTGLSAGRVASLLKRLEDRGLITRTRCSTNRRKYLIELTEDGKAVASDTERDMLRSHEEVLRALGEDDARDLLRLIERLCDVYRAHGED